MKYLKDRVEHLHINKKIKKVEGISLYISRRDKRIQGNPAIFYSIQLNKNVVMAVVPELQHVNERQRMFLKEGLKDLHERQNKSKGRADPSQKIPFVVLSLSELPNFIETYEITDIVLDYSPLRHYLEFDRQLVQYSKTYLNVKSISRVDAHNIVPYSVVGDNVKSGYAVKKRLLQKYDKYINEEYDEQEYFKKVNSKFKKTFVEFMNKKANQKRFWENLNFIDNLERVSLQFFPGCKKTIRKQARIEKNITDIVDKYKSDLRNLIKKHDLNASYCKRVPLKGDRASAFNQIDYFIENQLPYYSKLRNDVNNDCLSGISPYVNSGVISSREVVGRVCGLDAKTVVHAGIKDREIAGEGSTQSRNKRAPGLSSVFSSSEIVSNRSETETNLSRVSTLPDSSTSESTDQTIINSEKTGEISHTSLNVTGKGISLVSMSDLKEPVGKKRQRVHPITQSNTKSSKTHKGKRPLQVRIRSNAPILHQSDEDILTYLNEIFIWKETADYYLSRELNYDSFLGAPKWAKETLDVHRSDPRKKISLEKLILGETTDAEWNAAQKQMVITSKMHGYARMYWAKKIHTWLPPEQAVTLATLLNDTFSIDGNDPNGYLGVMWSTLGVMDQGFAEQPCLGKIRSMKSHKGKKYTIYWNRMVLRKPATSGNKRRK